MGRPDVHGDEAGSLRADHGGAAADPATRGLDQGHRHALQEAQGGPPQPASPQLCRQPHAEGPSDHDLLHVTA